MDAPAPAAPVKPRKRWKKILAIAGIALLGLILLVILIGPTVIGAVAKTKVQEILGEMLQSDVRVGGVSFSWSGRLGMEDFKITTLFVVAEDGRPQGIVHLHDILTSGAV